MKKSLPVVNVLTDFFNLYLPTAKGLSHNTITSYEYAFQLLFEYVNDEKQIPPESVSFQSLSNGTVLDYLNWLETNRQCSTRTRNQRLAAISSFAKYAMKQKFSEALTFGSEVINIPKKKVPKNDDVVYFTIKEIEIILGLPNNLTKIGNRDMVLLSVLYASGARAQELCDLTVNDIHFGEKTSLRLVGKGNKSRSVIITDECAELLKSYLQNSPMTTSQMKSRASHIFSSQTHEHMTVSCVEGIVKKYMTIAKAAHPKLFKCKSYSPHSFRHSIAVHMLESDIPLPVIKNFLGHASIQSTLVYAKVTPELANKYLREKGFGASLPKNSETTTPRTTLLPFLDKISKRNRSG
ncbi:MAG: site-specific integrase [Oscillospiraceae bacterium]|jgi:site-specific recombinase XerD|nr:site-specific integrase [Oscillospiraceae bacterium]